VTARVRLGDLTCPSGDLVIIDGGYLGIWSGQGSPASVDPVLLGIDDPDTASDIRDAVDFEIVGPDAAAATLLLGQRIPGQSLYDVPASSATEFTQAFEALCLEGSLDAALRELDRVPHRDRVRRAVTGRGIGPFTVFGVPAVAVGGLPTDRPLWIEAVGEDGFWSAMYLVLAEGTATNSSPVGTVGVDWARLAFADADAIAAWEHDEPIDGLADVAFWGRSQEEAAQTHDAALLATPGDAGSYGWADLPVLQAAQRAQAVLAWVEASPERKLMVDFRPHSDHWRVMREVRASPTSSGTVSVGGARILFAMTGRGDGFFPVYADRDAAGTLLAVRIALDEAA
jgi:hypothetical protein